MDFEQVQRVCHDYTFIGLKAILAARSESPTASDKQFRFLYISGSSTERDQTKTPRIEARYLLMRVSIRILSPCSIMSYHKHILLITPLCDLS